MGTPAFEPHRGQVRAALGGEVPFILTRDAANSLPAKSGKHLIRLTV